jgi:hypothetical protein
MTIDSYPGIIKAGVLMARCNGGINITRTEQDVKDIIVSKVLRRPPKAVTSLKEIDDWLLTLTDDELQTCVDGEETEMQALWDKGPPGVSELLLRIFHQAA